MSELAARALEAWRGLAVGGPAKAKWVIPPADGSTRATILLGAFDPLTSAHLAIASACARIGGPTGGAEAALGMTKVVLARSQGGLLPVEERVKIVAEVCARMGLAFTIVNSGRYLDAKEAIGRTGVDPVFVVGQDKVSQLADPSFYDGDAEQKAAAVEATFTELDLLVVRRQGAEPADIPARRGVLVLDVADVFEDPRLATLSATEVRSRVAAGLPITGLVPPEVQAALRGYTAGR